MPAQPIVPIRDSIAKHLLRVVFSLYFVVTVTVTLTQMSAVYLQQKESVEEGLVVIQHTFGGVLSSALWKLDPDQVNSALMGVMKYPSIIGVKISNQHGGIVAQLGVVTDEEGNQMRVGIGGATDSEERVTGIFWHSFPLEYMFLGNTEVQGEATVYSSSEVIFKRVQLGFAFIIVNSIIKTVAIWFLFLWAFRRILGRPLMILSASIERLNLESLENQPEDGQDLDLKIMENNELMVLEIKFNDMTRRLREGVASRRELQQAAVQQRNQFYTTLRSIGDGVITTDKKGNVTFINPVAQTLTGWNLEEAVDRQLTDVFTIINEETRQVVENLVAKVIWTDSVVGLVNHTILISKDKKEIPIDNSGALIKDEKGGVTGIVLVFRDNTERKLAEEALRESEEKLNLIINASPIGICTVDPLGNFSTTNPAYERMVGYSKEELRRLSFFDLTHPDNRPKNKKLFQSMFSLETTSFSMKKRYIHKDGSEIDVAVHATGIMDSEGNVRFGTAFVDDITERKRMERALREKHLQLQAILDHSPALISIKDMEGTVILANRNFEVLDIPPLEEFIGKNIFELFPKEVAKDLWQNDLMALEKDGPIEAEEVVNHKDGTLHTYLTIKFPLYFENREPFGICAISTDITERKKLESKLQQTQKMESIGTLAGGVAHEINNPINGIMNYAQLIQDKIGEENPLSEYTSEIIHETKRVSKIVKNLLVFARQEKESHSPARINDIVYDTMSLIQTVLKRDQITLIADISEDLPKIKCRSQQIQQVVMNLITNARDSLNEKYPGFDDNKKIEILSVFFEKDDRRWIRTTVEDRGLGIAPDTMERMFDPFYTTKERAKGTGLGLSISYGIVKDHHGKLSVESEPGLYTRFHMDLPVDNGWDLKKKNIGGLYETI